MSKFLTILHVDLTPITKNLPKGAILDGPLKLDAKGNIEVRWDCDSLVTPYTFHTEFPLKNLQERTLPGGVKPRAQIDAERRAKTEAAKQQSAHQPTPNRVLANVSPRSGFVCAKCEKPIHWDGESKYLHSEPGKYKHEAVKAEPVVKESIDTSSTPDGQNESLSEATVS